MILLLDRGGADGKNYAGIRFFSLPHRHHA